MKIQLPNDQEDNLAHGQSLIALKYDLKYGIKRNRRSTVFLQRYHSCQGNCLNTIPCQIYECAHQRVSRMIELAQAGPTSILSDISLFLG